MAWGHDRLRSPRTGSILAKSRQPVQGAARRPTHRSHTCRRSARHISKAAPTSNRRRAGLRRRRSCTPMACSTGPSWRRSSRLRSSRHLSVGAQSICNPYRTSRISGEHFENQQWGSSEAAAAAATRPMAGSVWVLAEVDQSCVVAVGPAAADGASLCEQLRRGRRAGGHVSAGRQLA